MLPRIACRSGSRRRRWEASCSNTAFRLGQSRRSSSPDDTTTRGRRRPRQYATGSPSGTTTSHLGGRWDHADIAATGEGNGTRCREQSRLAREDATAMPVKLLRKTRTEAITKAPQITAGTKVSWPTKATGAGQAVPWPNSARAGSKLHGSDLVAHCRQARRPPLRSRDRKRQERRRPGC